MIKNAAVSPALLLVFSGERGRPRIFLQYYIAAETSD
jgi:hypothetical protein